MSGTTAVVIAYHPDTVSFRALLTRLDTCVDAIVVVDNASSSAVRALCRDIDARIDYVDPGGNVGVASALNRGVERAWQSGADFVLLSDHDSLPAEDMVQRLLEVHTTLSASGARVAAVGPGFADRQRPHEPPFVRIEGGRFKRISITPADPPLPLDFLITSGSLISRAAWQAIGPMNEQLFIDLVDIEWGLRGRERGWRCFGVPAAQMSHAIGEMPRQILGRRVSVHSPIRRYYQVRNSVWLHRQPWMPSDWKRAEGPKTFLKIFVLAILVGPRWKTLKMSLIGFWHGLLGRMGPLDAPRSAQQ